MRPEDVTLAECYFDSGPKWWEARCRHCKALLAKSENPAIDVEATALDRDHLCTELESVSLLRRIEEYLGAVRPTLRWAKDARLPDVPAHTLGSADAPALHIAYAALHKIAGCPTAAPWEIAKDALAEIDELRS